MREARRSHRTPALAGGIYVSILCRTSEINKAGDKDISKVEYLTVGCEAIYNHCIGVFVVFRKGRQALFFVYSPFTLAGLSFEDQL